MGYIYTGVTSWRKLADDEESFARGAFLLGLGLVTVSPFVAMMADPTQELQYSDCWAVWSLISAIPWWPWSLREWMFGLSGLTHVMGLALVVLYGYSTIWNSLLREGSSTFIYSHSRTIARSVSPLDAVPQGISLLATILMSVVLAHSCAYTYWGFLRAVGSVTAADLLLTAAKKRDVNGMRAAIAYGASPNSKDSGGWTPLLHAARSGDEAAIKYLVTSGANLEATVQLSDLADQGDTALFIAVAQGHYNIVRLLTDAGANSNATPHSQAILRCRPRKYL